MSPASSFPAASVIALMTASDVASRVRIVVVSKPRASPMRDMSRASASHARSWPDQPP
jgi:hypothetical protein